MNQTKGIPSQPCPPTEFESGAKRDEGERMARFDLICPSAIYEYAKVCKEGATRYGERNWEKGIPTSNYIDHALEHLMAYLSFGYLQDLTHALWNIAAAIHNQTECEHNGPA